jgi:hypothetical protein
LPGVSYLKSLKKTPVKVRISFSLFLGLFSLLSFAQPELQFPEQIMGEWKGTGALFGKEASFSMKWEAPLGNHFLNLEFHNSFSDANGVERSMDAEAYYGLKTGQGYWFDSRGQVLPLHFEISGNTMTVFWGDETSEMGKTIYTINPSGVTVEDFVYRGQEYAPFGNAAYFKAD